MLGITYDPRSEALEIMLEGLGHNISRVSEIYVEHDGGNLKSIQAVDADGTQHLIRMREPVALPLPGDTPAPD
jgi:hypothetical protein